MRKLALFGSLSEKLKEKKIICVEGFSKSDGKTKHFLQFLSRLPIVDDGSKKILLILAKSNEQLVRSARNLKNLSWVNIANLSSYQVLSNDFLLLEKEALASIGNLFIKNKKLEKSKDE
ncbi:50S ribosomal protein L4 [Candidatus Curtissbacteria bacterium RBG_16_39_7]|uniref:50S ribosomal protein L4 n=1 Tax=Candidatus Curtissbacteria bacterium RBG_16_39_7 TaxID=1797707 RepID=A0A1F5G1H8_9BACT|nr:MAG: 50S ribosomal protein L4 [Candidatus Curtissbacteria bacterium RBG_16_39_7]